MAGISSVTLRGGCGELEDKEAVLGLVVGANVVAVTVNLPWGLLCVLDERCCASKVCFVNALCTSVFGTVFYDFGESFFVSDKDGENPATSQVDNILCSNPAVVKVLEDQGRDGLETGDCVTLSKVRDLFGLLADGDAKHKVKVTGPYTFELTGVDALGYSEPATH
ncbi:hypothetical protein ACHAWF_000172, partial [Thalassiosira exigua]